MIWFGHSLRDSLIYLIPLFRQKQRDPCFFFFKFLCLFIKLEKKTTNVFLFFFAKIQENNLKKKKSQTELKMCFFN